MTRLPGSELERADARPKHWFGPRRSRESVKLPSYDTVLLTGSDKELNEYISTSGKCLVVDWRSEEGSLVDALAEILPEAKLGHEWVEAEDDIYLTYRGRRYKVGLTLSGRDRYITLRRLNEVMVGDYELRGFRHTLGDDTHCFYPATCEWWAAMDKAFATEVERVFARLTVNMDFPDYL